MNEYKIHESANSLLEYDITDLVESMRKNGQLQPILLWRGLVVDGRHRLKACIELGLEVFTYSLADAVEEHELDRAVLDAQLLRRGVDKISASCEVLLYLEKTGEQQNTVLERYSIVTKDALKNIKIIKEVRPLWFSVLRQQRKVEWNTGQYSDALRKLADICRKEKSGATETKEIEWKAFCKPDKYADLKRILKEVKELGISDDILDFLKLDENQQETALLAEW